jgi:hypothetical protein
MEMIKIVGETRLNETYGTDPFIHKEVKKWETNQGNFYSVEFYTGSLEPVGLARNSNQQFFLTEKEMEKLADFYNHSKQEEQNKKGTIDLNFEIQESIYLYLKTKSENLNLPISKIIETYLKVQLDTEKQLKEASNPCPQGFVKEER